MNRSSKRMAVSLFLASLAFSLSLFASSPQLPITGYTGNGAKNPDGTSTKGQFGRVVPIDDNNHPNLYWNRDEIDELRNMILVQRSPQNLVDLYDGVLKGAIAQNE